MKRFIGMSGVDACYLSTGFVWDRNLIVNGDFGDGNRDFGSSRKIYISIVRVISCLPKRS